MNDFIYRLILSALSLMLFYSIYRLLLNRLALLNAGRAYLIITMLMALLIPLPWQRLIESPAEIAFVVNLDMATIIQGVQTESAGTFNWWNLGFFIYLFPAVFLFIFFFYSNLRLMILLRKGEEVKWNPASCHVEQRETSFRRFLRSFTSFRMTGADQGKIILLEQEVLPFSWFGRIVMSRNDYESRHAKSIIAHELTHIRQHHFIDLLLAELLIVLQWFNPAAWAYRSAVRDMHEYLADKGTIKSGYAIVEYQRLLATLAGPVTAGILSNNMKHSTLKNRFTMMTKTNNRKPATFRLALAIVAVTMVSFGVFISACQTGTKKAETETTEQETIEVPSEQITDEQQTPTDISEEIFIVVEEPPSFTGGDEARIKYISENIKYPEEARAKGIQGTVFVTFVVEADGAISDEKLLRGIGGGCDEEAVRVIESMPKWVPGKQRGQAVRVQFNMPIRFLLE